MKKPDPYAEEIDPRVSQYMAELGRKGGQSKSAKKAESSRKNLRWECDLCKAVNHIRSRKCWNCKMPKRKTEER